jgi:ribonuclease Z
MKDSKMDGDQTSHTTLYASPEIAFDPGPPRDFSPEGASAFAVVLGSGKPEPTIHRSGPAGAIVANATPYIIDAGEGVWRAIARAATAHDGKLAASFAPPRLTRIFLTHLHSDHTVGLPAFLLLPWTCGCDAETHVYGPIGTKRLVESILDAYAADIAERVHGPEGKDDIGWRAVAHEIEAPGLVHEDENVSIRAFPHVHGGFAQNFGYRVETGDRTFAWAGDGVASEAFREAIRGIDVLCSDAAPVAESGNPAPWRGYDRRPPPADIWHIRTDVLGSMAREAGVRQLVIHHEQNYSRPYDVDALAKEASQAFGGPVISARDGDIF